MDRYYTARELAGVLDEWAVKVGDIVYIPIQDNFVTTLYDQEVPTAPTFLQLTATYLGDDYWQIMHIKDRQHEKDVLSTTTGEWVGWRHAPPVPKAQLMYGPLIRIREKLDWFRLRPKRTVVLLPDD